MNRRDLLKKAGLGSVASASLLSGLAEPALADGNGQLNLHFGVVNQQVGGLDRIILAGAGRFNASQVEGGGSFTRFTLSGTPPFPIVSAGSWKVKRLVSFVPAGTYGTITAGVLLMEVHLIPTVGPVIPATLEVVCNVPPGAIFTGEPEGVTLTVSGGPTFVPTGTGLTAFTTGNEQKD